MRLLKMKCIVIAALLLALIAQSVPLSGTVAVAAKNELQVYAEKLKAIGVFQGTEKGFELDRKQTRLESLVMLIRLLGKESEALRLANQPSPFTDVPEWGKGYVNYAYGQGLSSGTGSGTFGSEDEISVNQYVTFLLRAIGYSDGEGDFSWDHALDKAVEIHLIDSAKRAELEQGPFIRGTVAELSYLALKQTMKSSDKVLGQKLVDQGSIEASTAESIGIVTAATWPSDLEPVTFEDPALENVIRHLINKPDGVIYVKDVLGITKIEHKDISDYSQHRIRSLEGIQSLRNLTYLGLTYSLVSDISPLSGLTELKFLYLTGSRVGDLTPLAGLTNLEILYLQGNFIRNVAPLANLTKLKTLLIDNNDVTDISMLGNLDELESFSFAGNVISSIEVIPQMAALTNAGFDNNPITDMSPVPKRLSRETDEYTFGQIEQAGKLAHELVNRTVQPGMTDLQKEEAIHDALLDQVLYDYQYYHTKIPTKTDPAGLYGAMVEGYSVCAGYATALKVLGRLAGLDITEISGVTTDGVGHGWNLIKLNGITYHVDATWDDGDPWSANGSEMNQQRRKREHFNLTPAQRIMEIRYDVERYPADKTMASSGGGNSIQVKINSELPVDRDLLVWLKLDYRYKKGGTEYIRMLQVPTKFPAGADTVNAVLDLSAAGPLEETAVKYYLSYELYDISSILGSVRDFMTESGGLGSTASGAALQPNDQLHLTLLKVGSKGVTFNQAAAAQQEVSQYALKASSFDVTPIPQLDPFIAKSDAESHIVRYELKNNSEIILPPGSALYLLKREALPMPIEEDYYSYNYGGEVFVANHTADIKIIKPGELNYAYISREIEGLEAKIYLRLSVFDGEFKDKGDYKTYVDTNKVLFKDNWLQPQLVGNP